MGKQGLYSPESQNSDPREVLAPDASPVTAALGSGWDEVLRLSARAMPADFQEMSKLLKDRTLKES